MGATQRDRQSQFFEWLAKSVSSAQLSELYYAFTDLEDALSSGSYLCVCSQPLTQITDANAVDKLYNALRLNEEFMTHSFKSGLKLSLLRHYARYCRECRPANAVLQLKEASSGDVLVDCLRKEGIPFTDNRSKKGALWVSKSDKTDALIRKFEDHGVRFVFSESKQQWWTRDPSPKTVETPKAVEPVKALDPAVVKANQQAFMKWLQDQELDIVDAYSIYNTAGKIHKALLSKGMKLGLFGTQGIKRIRACVDTAKQKEAFVKGAKAENRLWIKTLDCYLRFAEAMDLFGGVLPVKSAPTVPQTATLSEDATHAGPVGVAQISVSEPVERLASEACPRPWSEQKKPDAQAEKNAADAAQANVSKPTERLESKADPRSLSEQNKPDVQAGKPAVGTTQPGVSETRERLTSEAGFRLWLEQNKPDAQVGFVIEAVRRADRFALGNHMRALRLWGVSPSAMRLAINRLVASKAFAKSGARQYQAFKRAVPLLLEYAKTMDGVVEKAASARPEATANTKPAPMQSETDAKERAVLEPSLSDLLRGDQFSILRQALLEKGINTLEAFRQLNLWVFMNQNGLYSIGQRQAIYSTVRRAMASESASDAPWKLITQAREYAGASPAEALMEYCRAVALKYPLKFRGLIGQQIRGTGLIPLMRSRLHAKDPRMDNPEVYINSAYSANTIWACAQWISAMCRDDDLLRELICLHPAHGENAKNAAVAETASEKRETCVEPSTKETASPTAPEAFARPSAVSPLREQVEKLVLTADLEGMSLKQLCDQASTTMAALKQVRDASHKLVDMGDKLVHVDAFVDWEEAAAKLAEILEKLLTKNNGYVSSSQLYDFAKVEMQMFLNDNDIDDEQSIYCIARHLFEKEGWHGVRYAFASSGHISRGGKDALYKTMDVIDKFAREHNGFFRYDDLVAYLEQVDVRTGNLRGQMRIGDEPRFFYYSGVEIISAKSMAIDETWLAQAEKALKRLFADVGDHIVLRSIDPIWYEQLPALPGRRPWTPMLLQYVLQFYGRQLAAKTVGAELNQRYDALHAMLVSWNSEVQTFADAVIAYLVDCGISERQFEAEKLRETLVRGRLIAGNELYKNMPKAIGRDPRFAWDAAGENVSIKV